MPSASQPAARQPQRSGGYRRGGLARPGGACSVPVRGAVASSPLLDHCVMVQVPAGDVIITRDAWRGGRRGVATVFNSRIFPFLFGMAEISPGASAGRRPHAPAAALRWPLARWLFPEPGN